MLVSGTSPPGKCSTIIIIIIIIIVGVYPAVATTNANREANQEAGSRLHIGQTHAHTHSQSDFLLLAFPLCSFLAFLLGSFFA